MSEEGAAAVVALAVKMNRKSFSRITWLVGAGVGKSLLPFSIVPGGNVVCVFQVQKTQESCCELRGQKDAKWDLRRTRYGEICFPSQREFCFCRHMFVC